MAADGLQHGYIEFLKRVAVITFTEVIRVIANGMRDVELLVYFIYHCLSVGILLQALGVFLLVWRYPNHTLIFATGCSQPREKALHLGLRHPLCSSEQTLIRIIFGISHVYCNLSMVGFTSSSFSECKPFCQVFLNFL